MRQVERFPSGANAVTVLVAGKLDFVIIDNEPAKAFVAANEGLKILDTAYALEDYAIAVSKDNPELFESSTKRRRSSSPMARCRRSSTNTSTTRYG